MPNVGSISHAGSGSGLSAGAGFVAHEGDGAGFVDVRSLSGAGGAITHAGSGLSQAGGLGRITHQGAGTGAVAVMGLPSGGAITHTGAGGGYSYVVFPYPCDWQEFFRETRAHLTAVFQGDDLTEQRRRIRLRSRRSWEWRLTGIDAREMAALNTLLYTASGRELLYPFWPHATVLTAPAGPGDTVLAADLTDREFYPGGHALLWRDNARWELVSVAGATDTALTLNAPLGGTWAAGAVLAPAYAGRMVEATNLTRPHGWQGYGTLRVDITDASIPASPAAHDDVIALMQLTDMPDAEQDRYEQVQRALITMDSPSGPSDYVARRANPVSQLPWVAKLLSAADGAAFWTWYEGVCGRWRPAWVPDFFQFAQLARDHTAGESTLDIEAMGYTQLLFPHEARRHLAIVPAPGGAVHRRVVDAVDNGDGTETLTLNGTIGSILDAEHSLVCFLRYARLLNDAVTVEWSGPGLGEATLEFVDLPWEVPAA